MTNSLAAPQVSSTLARMFAEAARDGEHAPPPPPGLSSWDEAPALDRSTALQDFYIPISAEAGQLLYALVRAIRP